MMTYTEQCLTYGFSPDGDLMDLCYLCGEHFDDRSPGVLSSVDERAVCFPCLMTLYGVKPLTWEGYWSVVEMILCHGKEIDSCPKHGGCPHCGFGGEIPCDGHMYLVK